MRILSCDVETYSSVELSDSGVYKYVESPDFEILLLGYKWSDQSDVHVIDLTSKADFTPEEQEVIDALSDPNVLKTAYNAQFERTCFAKWLHRPMPPEQWDDTMVRALELGLPGSLAGAGIALGLPAEKLKDPRGKALISYFSKPCKPTKANNGRTRNLPAHNPERWQLYIEYNRQDVVTEQAIREMLMEKVQPTEDEWDLWRIDQRINDHGVMIDLPMAKNIVQYDEEHQVQLQNEAREITGLENPNSLIQLKTWLNERGLPMDEVTKDTVREALKKDLPPDIRRVLTIRQALGKTSVKKYGAMLDAACQDHRIRGTLQFYGAARTGRWAGRIVQTHNLPRNGIADLDLARQLVCEGRFDDLELLFGEPAFVFGELVRTAFIPSPGHHFIVADFSAIEARVLGWLAGEEWVLNAFRQGKDIYCETASQMYHVPVVKHGENGHLRQKGKVAVLACIAEGQLVLTDRGLIPIENVTTEMKLWDGIEWVNHDGVVCNGEREVINYGGLEATKDHSVWTEINGKYQQLRFDDAATSGSCLLKSGAGRENLRLAEDHFPTEEIHERLERVHGTDRMHRLRTKKLDTSCKSDARQNKRLPKLQSTKIIPEMVGQTIYSGKTEMREPGRSSIQKLWGKRHKVRFSKCLRSLPLHDGGIGSTRQIDETGNRSDRQRWKLCPGKPEMGNQTGTMPEHTTIKKVYDIINAGPRHRFTVSNVLVHNCGYQGGVGAMKRMDREGVIPEEELQSVVNQWRDANSHIVKFWRTVEQAAKTAIREHRKVKVQSGLVFSYRDKNLYIQLPNGRSICYWNARIKEDPTGKESIVFWSVNAAHQWAEEETYGGKITENITQAVARDCLAETIKRVTAMGYQIVMHVHDEIIVDVPLNDTDAYDKILTAMKEPIPWAEGLPLNADGYTCEYYRKD